MFARKSKIVGINGAPWDQGAATLPTYSELKESAIEALWSSMINARKGEKRATKAGVDLTWAIDAFYEEAAISRHAWIDGRILDQPTRARLIGGMAGLSNPSKAKVQSLLKQHVFPIAHTAYQNFERTLPNLEEALRFHFHLAGLKPTPTAREIGLHWSTLRTWMVKSCVPRTDETLQALFRLEKRLGTLPGALTRHVAATGARKYKKKSPPAKETNPLEEHWRQITPHLPHDFASRSDEEQYEIALWVRNTMVWTARDDDDDGGDRTPYRYKFRAEPQNGADASAKIAPDRLLKEVQTYVEHMTAARTKVGKTRESRWSKERGKIAETFLGMFFGALAQTGHDPNEFTLLDAADPDKVRDFASYMEARRGFPTKSITGAIDILVASFNPTTGFVVQHRDLFATYRPDLPKGPALAEFCENTVRNLYAEKFEWEPDVQAGRNSHLPVEVVLREDRPIDVYKTILDEIDRVTPSRNAAPKLWARAQRDKMLVALLLVLPLRARNVADLLMIPKGKKPPTFAELERAGCGCLYHGEHKKTGVAVLRFRQPKKVFKNHRSPATEDVDVALIDFEGLYKTFENYLPAREILLNGKFRSDRVFVRDFTRASKLNEIDAAHLSNIFKTLINKYGVYNPYTGNGAIRGLKTHRIQHVRHVVATHLVKTIGVTQAAARLFDSERMIWLHYGSYTAGEKFEDSDAGYAARPANPVCVPVAAATGRRRA